MIENILLLGGALVAIIAVVLAVSARVGVPESTLLCLVGVVLGGGYISIVRAFPMGTPAFLVSLIESPLPAQAYLWLFLPPLLFQAALSVNVRELASDIAPILLLAVVAVFVATGVVGVSVAYFGPSGIAGGLLLGAVIATTDPSAVIAIFREIGVPARLTRLMEGESLLNDAAAIAISGVLIGYLTGDSTGSTFASGLHRLLVSFGGGLVFGAIVGRLCADAFPFMGGKGPAEIALSLAMPYPVYLVAEQVLGVSGVVAIVTAGLVLSGTGRTRLSPQNWGHLQIIWEQVGAIAGAAVYLLAALRIPFLLQGATFSDLLVLPVVIAAALLARLLVLFGLFPVLSWLKFSEPVNSAYKLAIAWGGLRGAITLVLALGIAENEAISAATRHFIAILATGFVLFSLFVNGTTLGRVVRALKLNELSPQDMALQQQALRLSTDEVVQEVERAAGFFKIDPAIGTMVSEEYKRDVALGSVVFDFDAAVSERDKIAIGLVALATRERDLIPQYGSGTLTIRNLDAMMRNAGRMIDAARAEGRTGYKRISREVLSDTFLYRVGLWLHRVVHLDYLLVYALSNRFELLVCRRAVLEQLRSYNTERLAPMVGARQAKLLESVLQGRIDAVAEALAEMRKKFGMYTTVLERRLLVLYALRYGRRLMDEMVQDRTISKEAYDWVLRALDSAWRKGVRRPTLPSHLREK